MQRLPDVGGEGRLVVLLDAAEASQQVGVVEKALQLVQFLEMADPAVADAFGDQRREGGVGLQQPAALCHTVGLVAEFLRELLGKVGEDALAQDAAVQRGHAVDGARADDGQVRHAHPLAVAFVDEAHPLQSPDVARVARRDLAQEAPVDLVDDLHVPRQQALHEADAPVLEGLRQHGVVRVAGAGARDGPRLIPVEHLAVEQDAHELRHHQRRVRVVQLDEDALRQAGEGQAVGPEAAQDVLDRAGDEEVLLAQPQLLALQDVVVGVEHLRQVLRQHLPFDRLDVGAAVEVVEVERVRGLRLPEAQRVDRLGAVAHHGHVVGHALHGMHGDPAPVYSPVDRGHFDAALEADLTGVLGPGDLPDIALVEPVVGLLDLRAVQDALLEDAVVVAQPVADGRQVHRRQGVEKAGRQPSQAAVAEAGVGLVGAEALPVHVELGQRLAAVPLHLHVDDVAGQETAHQKLEGEIVDALDVVAVVALLGEDPAFNDAVTHRRGQGDVAVAVGG